MPANPKFKRRVYTLKGKSPEVIAVAFAKCSRSPEPFDKIVKEINQNKASKFHEKYVVGFGHGSVAEHAYLNVAVENVTQRCVAELENCRLASYTEKSSRYQIFNPEACYIPKSVTKNKALKKRYLEVMEALFGFYKRSIEPVKAVIMKQIPREKGEDDNTYEMRIRSKWIDICRMMLPYASLTNLGVSANGRTYEHMITKLASSELPEARDLAWTMKKVVQKELPTLVKYAGENPYIMKTQKALNKQVKTIPEVLEKNKFSVKLIDYDRNGEQKFVAAIIYRNSNLSYSKCLALVKKMSARERAKWIKEGLSRLTSVHDKPLRELELIYFTLDICVDHGTYYDLKRQRILTPIYQKSSASIGYVVPKVIERVGLRTEFEDMACLAAKAYEEFEPKVGIDAQYLVTKCHYKRFLFHMNMREFFYVLWYRGVSPAGHLSYRTTTMMMYDVLKKVYPGILKYAPYEITEGSRVLYNKFFAD